MDCKMALERARAMIQHATGKEEWIVDFRADTAERTAYFSFMVPDRGEADALCAAAAAVTTAEECDALALATIRKERGRNSNG